MMIAKTRLRIFAGSFTVGALIMLTSGCASLVLKEKERALDSAFEKGKIDKIQYYTEKSKLQLQQEQTKAIAQQKNQ